MQRRFGYLLLLVVALGVGGYCLGTYIFQLSPRVEVPRLVDLGRHKLGQQAVVDSESRKAT